MTFEFAIKVSPPSIFGVPEEGLTVVPAGEARQVIGPPIRTSVLMPFGHGSLSEYRKDAESLRFRLEQGGVALQIKDNFWIASADAEDLQSASAKVQPVVIRLMHFLSVEYGVAFTYEGLFVDVSDGTTRGWPKATQVSMTRATVYDLPALHARIEDAFRAAHRSDTRLEKAYAYFENALQVRGFAMAAVHEAATSMLWSLAFLQLWKTITTILGDPSSDSDYQSRFRTFGLPNDFWKAEVDPLYRVRSQEDVAHYKLDSSSQAASESFGKAVLVAQRVLRAYIGHLHGSAPVHVPARRKVTA